MIPHSLQCFKQFSLILLKLRYFGPFVFRPQSEELDRQSLDIMKWKSLIFLDISELESSCWLYQSVLAFVLSASLWYNTLCMGIRLEKEVIISEW